MADWSPEDNEKPHGLLSQEQRDAIEQSGPPWLRFDGESWWEVYYPSWFPAVVYRVCPKPAPRPLTVEPEFWEAFPTAKYVARDEDGSVYAYTGPVRPHVSVWVRYPKNRVRPMRINLDCTFIDPGTCDWREAIAERPEGV